MSSAPEPSWPVCAAVLRVPAKSRQMSIIRRVSRRRRNPHNHFLWSKTTVCLDFKIEFCGFGIEIKPFIFSWWVLFTSVVTDRPLPALVGFKPMRCVSKLVVRIIFERYRRARGPFSMFFGNSLSTSLVRHRVHRVRTDLFGYTSQFEFLALSYFTEQNRRYKGIV